MIDTLLAEAKERMQKSVDSVRTEFSTLRTGRANPGILDRVSVDYYGASTPLKQLAQVGAPEARMLTVMPYDKGAIRDIERAIAESELGLNPSNDGQMIRLSIPELTEDRRKDLVKIAGKMAEEGRIAVRNIRRDILQQVKELQRSGDISEDDERRAEADMKKVIDEYVASIDSALKSKEAEIMEV